MQDKAADELAGMRARCPKCKAVIQLGQPEAPVLVAAPPVQESELLGLREVRKELSNQTDELKKLNKEFAWFMKGLRWWLLWLTLFSLVSCLDSCQRLIGEQETKVRVIPSSW